ncbi:hypothetical protein BCR44DRAFT_35566 [Catenaria anguillulae PL171]|uniref:Uncharacterized protein n=1 Tax=Catenaria anguillulae PL171 TaxID=765915 RepID=A0A1Y2HIT3_9FUNG|nr:hypothetical protein BCR44DRAFT_35566 [Catenaria anguillulae PL171]
MWNFDTVKSAKPPTPSSTATTSPTSSAHATISGPPSSGPGGSGGGGGQTPSNALSHAATIMSRKAHRRNQSSVFMGPNGLEATTAGSTTTATVRSNNPSPAISARSIPDAPEEDSGIPVFDSPAQSQSEGESSTGTRPKKSSSGQAGDDRRASKSDLPRIKTKDLTAPHIPRSYSESGVYNPLMHIFNPPSPTSQSTATAAPASASATNASYSTRQLPPLPPPSDPGLSNSPISPGFTTSPSMPFIIDTSILSPNQSPPSTPLHLNPGTTDSPASTASGGGGIGARPRQQSLTSRLKLFSKSRAMDARLYKPIHTISSAFRNTGSRHPTSSGNASAHMPNGGLAQAGLVEEFPPLRPRASTAPEIRTDLRPGPGIRRLSFLLNFTTGGSSSAASASGANSPTAAGSPTSDRDPSFRDRKGSSGSASKRLSREAEKAAAAAGSGGASVPLARRLSTSGGLFGILSSSLPASPSGGSMLAGGGGANGDPGHEGEHAHGHGHGHAHHPSNSSSSSTSLFARVRSGSVSNFFKLDRERKGSVSQSSMTTDSLPLADQDAAGVADTVVAPDPENSFVQLVNLPPEAQQAADPVAASQVIRSLSLASLFETSQMVDGNIGSHSSFPSTSLGDLAPTKEEEADQPESEVMNVVVGGQRWKLDGLGTGLARPIPMGGGAVSLIPLSPSVGEDPHLLPSPLSAARPQVPSLGVLKCPKLVADPDAYPAFGCTEEQLEEMDDQIADLAKECIRWLDHADKSFRALAEMEQP